MRIRTIATVVGTLLTESTAAHADLLPAPDYVESCGLATVQQPDEQCLECRDAFHGNPEACRTTYGPQGYRERCRTAGASVWTEIWCRPNQAAEPPPPPTTATATGPFATPPDATAVPTNAVAAPAQPAPQPVAGGPSPAEPGPPALPPDRSGACGACATGSSRGSWAWALLGVGLAGLVGLGRRRSSRR